MSRQAYASSYIPRYLAPMLAEALTDAPVVCLLGPRQCGTSTLARHCDPDRAYINLDDRNYLALAANDPEGFLDGLPERVTIDEIQRVSELTLAIKRSVDANRQPGRLLMTGSAKLLQLPRLADSLAGRMEMPLSAASHRAGEAPVAGRVSRNLDVGRPPRDPALEPRSGRPRVARASGGRRLPRGLPAESPTSPALAAAMDIVFEAGSRVGGVEVKAAASVQPGDGKGLRRLAEAAGGRFNGGLVLYDGEAVLPIERDLNIHAVPLAKLWEL